MTKNKLLQIFFKKDLFLEQYQELAISNQTFFSRIDLRKSSLESMSKNCEGFSSCNEYSFVN